MSPGVNRPLTPDYWSSEKNTFNLLEPRHERGRERKSRKPSSLKWTLVEPKLADDIGLNRNKVNTTLASRYTHPQTV